VCFLIYVVCTRKYCGHEQSYPEILTNVNIWSPLENQKGILCGVFCLCVFMYKTMYVCTYICMYICIYVFMGGPLSLVSTIEELLGRKHSGSGLENREYGRRDPSSWPRGTLYPQKLALTSPTSGGRSVGTVCSRTQAAEFSFLSVYICIIILYK
jgi:hypothetical protein